MVKKNMNEGKKGPEKNRRKNIRTQQYKSALRSSDNISIYFIIDTHAKL
jgi:hypothetical protein